jgi:hypothetical protein
MTTNVYQKFFTSTVVDGVSTHFKFGDHVDPEYKFDWHIIQSAGVRFLGRLHDKQQWVGYFIMGYSNDIADGQRGAPGVPIEIDYVYDTYTNTHRLPENYVLNEFSVAFGKKYIFTDMTIEDYDKLFVDYIEENMLTDEYDNFLKAQQKFKDAGIPIPTWELVSTTP